MINNKKVSKKKEIKKISKETLKGLERLIGGCLISPTSTRVIEKEQDQYLVNIIGDTVSGMVAGPLIISSLTIFSYLVISSFLSYENSNLEESIYKISLLTPLVTNPISGAYEIIKKIRK